MAVLSTTGISGVRVRLRKPSEQFQLFGSVATLGIDMPRQGQPGWSINLDVDDFKLLLAEVLETALSDDEWRAIVEGALEAAQVQA